MFYNPENLFDIADDTLTLDNEFLPGGGRRWTASRLYTKLTRISKVITNTGNWEPPAVIGLCEVENRQVLEKLVSHPPLRNWNYAVIHKDSPDERGIDVAALYRPDLFNPLSYRYFPPAPEGQPVPSTREILYLEGILGGVDTLHLFFNHWPSRYGGLMETRPLRRQAALRLRREIGRLRERTLHPAVVVMGDFNDQPDDASIRETLQAAAAPAGHPDSLCNLSAHWLQQDLGTLKHQSQWNIFDQVIVSERLLDTCAALFCLPADARILDASFLLETDEKYAGQKLHRTYSGFQYQGGYSDHLPVLLLLRNRQCVSRRGE